MEGRSLGPYEILEKLGTGGMGVVYLARDTRLQRQVALKVIEYDAAAAADQRQLIHEARAAARLNHPHIASVYDVIEEVGRLSIVMEYASGRSLASLVRHGPVAVDLAIAVGAQLADAVAYAHEQGVIHRDIKPANVHLTDTGTAKLLDLGIAAILPANQPSSGAGAPETGQMTIRGTPAYMAPEQIAGSPADARGDIYSLGALLYELVTGRTPFAGKTFADQLVAAASAPPPRASSINPAIPRELDDAIHQALSPRPDARQSSAHELARQLRALQSGRSKDRTLEEAVASPSRTRWRVFAYVFAAIVSVLCTIPIAIMLRSAGAAGDRNRPTVVAVLPVRNVTGDPSTEAAGTAIASLLVSNVGTLPGVVMLSRTETAPYRSARDDVPRIGREVGADLIVDLAAQTRPSSQVVVTAIVKRRDGSTQWSQTFEGDVFNVERQLLDGIARSLHRNGAVRGTPDEAQWARVRKLPTRDAVAMNEYSQGLLLLEKRDSPADLERAGELFGSAAHRDPAFGLAFAGLAESLAVRYQRTRDPALAQRAIDAADMALQLDPEHSSVRVAMAAVRYVFGRRKEAIAELRRALQAQPDNDEAFRLLGRSLSEEGNVEGAVTALRQALVIRPDYWNHHFTLGFILYSAGRLEEAAAEYQRTVELRPSYAAAYQMLGTTYYRLGDSAKAIGYYEQANTLGPTPGAVANLGYLYFKAGRYEQAVRAYEQALRLEGREPARHRNLADAYRKVGRHADANKEYAAAIALAQGMLKVNPHDANAISLMALCEARLSQREAAERHAAQALTVRQPTRDVLARVAQTYALIGNADAAVKSLAAAIKSGYQDAATDDEFDAIRSSAAFKAVVTTDKPR